MVGDKIREIRKSQSISLSELALRVGVSDSYISLLERNAADPSVSVLRKISLALKVPVSVFFDEDFAQPILIRRGEPNGSFLSSDGVRCTYLSPSGNDCAQKLEMISFQIPADGRTDQQTNTQETCIYLLKGNVSVHLQENVYELHAGDSIYIRRNVTYHLVNSGAAAVEGIACMTRRD